MAPHAPKKRKARKKARGRPGPKHISDKRIEAALRRTAGLFTQTAELLGINRATVHGHVNKSEHLQAVLKEIRETCLDMAEGNILTAIKNRDKDMSWRYMNQIGKARGYGNKIQVTADEEQLAAFVAALGGDPEALRAALVAAGAAPEEGQG